MKKIEYTSNISYDDRHYIQDCYGIVYQLISPSGKYYIGQTTNFKRRMQNYKGTGQMRHQRLLRNAIKSYGFDTFRVMVLYKCNSQEELNFMESILMPECVVNSGNSYNLMVGGGCIGKRSIETRKLLSEIHRGRPGHPHTDEYKKQLSLRMRGENHPMYNKHHSVETRNKISEAQIGVKRSAEALQSIKAKARRGVNHWSYGKTASDELRSKLCIARRSAVRGKFSEQAVENIREASKKRRGQSKYAEFNDRINIIIKDNPTFGCRRIYRILNEPRCPRGYIQHYMDIIKLGYVTCANAENSSI